jgi:transcriptional regulator with XRE-family HTH domain
VLILRLDKAMKDYRHRTCHNLTWKELARRVGVTPEALRMMRRPGHNTTLRRIEAIASELGIKALDLLEEVPGSPGEVEARKRKGRRTRQVRRA